MLMFLLSQRLALIRSHLEAYVIPSDPQTGLRCLLEHLILQSESRNARNSTCKGHYIFHINTFFLNSRPYIFDIFIPS
jgi:hypothetical protein